MKFEMEKLENNLVELKVEMPVEAVADAIERAAKIVCKEISLPGFRKGKVPRQLIEARFGVEVFYEEATDILLNESYPQFLEESGILPLEMPEVVEFHLEQGEPFTYTARVTVRPEVQLGQYKGLKADKVVRKVTEADVDAEIDRIRQSHSRMVVHEGAAELGDTTVIDYAGSIDDVAFAGGTAENHLLELGSGTFIPGFEDQLVGSKAGDEVDVIVTFPEEYGSADLAGKEAKFAVKVHEVKRTEIPELNEDFVLEVSEFETVADYRADITSKLNERAEEGAKQMAGVLVMNQAMANSTVEIPQVMVDREIDRMFGELERSMSMYGLSVEAYAGMVNKTVQEIREDMQQDAYDAVKRDLVLEAVIKAENLEIDEDKFRASLERMAQAYGQSLEELEEILAQNPSAKENMREGFLKDQAQELILESAVYTVVERAEKEPSVEEE